MILSVLKVIGIIILVILAILILVIGVILFTPVKYFFHAKMEDEPEANVMVKWWPVLLKATANYENSVFEYRVRMFGGLVMTNTDEKISWIGRKFFSKADEAEDIIDETIETELSEEDNIKHAENNVSDTQGVTVEKDETVNTADKKNKKQKKEHRKLRDIINDIIEKIRNIIDTIKGINEKKEALLKVYHSKIFEQVKNDVKGYIIELIRIVKPKKLSGYLRFGADDPSVTGEVFGVIAMFIPLYDGVLTVTPDFEEKILKANLDGKGKIYLISVLKLAIKIILNKKLIKVVKKVQTILKA